MLLCMKNAALLSVHEVQGGLTEHVQTNWKCALLCGHRSHTDMAHGHRFVEQGCMFVRFEP